MSLGEQAYDDMNKLKNEEAAFRQCCTIWSVILVAYIIPTPESAVDHHK